MKSIEIDVQLFGYLEANTPPEERKEGYDIADYLLNKKEISIQRSALQPHLLRNPSVRTRKPFGARSKTILPVFRRASEQSPATAPSELG